MYRQETAYDGGELTLDLLPPERAPRIWPKSVAEVARWCRAAQADPLPQWDVRGANEHERRQLAALGGVAAALAQSVWTDQELASLPPAVQKWLRDGPTVPAKLIDSIRRDFQSFEDPLALVYERIVAGHRRRQLGTFFTPRPVLEYMRSVIKSKRIIPKTVADPGAGVGAFTLAALKWWPDSDVYAVDVNLVTLGLLATRPDISKSIELAGQSRHQLHVRHEDFLQWLQNNWCATPGPRLILGNPPYTRHQQLTASEKRMAQALAGALAPGARAGLSTYFLAASLNTLEPKDSLCMLLPANWLEADYARSLRTHLWRSSHRTIELHIFPNELNVFPGAQVSAMILLVSPVRNKVQPLKVISIEGALDEGFYKGRVIEVQRQGDVPISLSPEKLNSGAGINRAIQDTSKIAIDSIAIVRRGVATGANSFFLRTGTEVQQLPEGSYIPAISRLRDLDGDTLDIDTHADLSRNGARCWLLNFHEDHSKSPRVMEIITEGVEKGINGRHLCKIRNPWYTVERILAPDILIGPMGKETFRIVVNTSGSVPTNTLYGLRIRNRSEPHLSETVQWLSNWLRSKNGQTALRAAARKHGDGLVKLEPRAVAQVKFPSSLLLEHLEDVDRPLQL